MSENIDDYKLSDDIEKLHLVLDRTINFISNCDTKVSFWLSTVGVIFTILLTVQTPNLKFIERICSTETQSTECFLVMAIIVFCIAFCFVIRGLFFLVNAIIARTECKEYSNSNIFFGHIAKHKNYKEYKKALEKCSLATYKEDLISQIYTNSFICDKKFRNYNLGAKYCLYSLPIIVSLWSYIF